jgi:hypothetical protein
MMQKSYYVIDIAYSQTDNHVAIIKAATEQDALQYVKTKCPNARHFSVVRVGEGVIEI